MNIAVAVIASIYVLFIEPRITMNNCPQCATVLEVSIEDNDILDNIGVCHNCASYNWANSNEAEEGGNLGDEYTENFQRSPGPTPGIIE